MISSATIVDMRKWGSRAWNETQELELVKCDDGYRPVSGKTQYVTTEWFRVLKLWLYSSYMGKGFHEVHETQK